MLRRNAAIWMMAAAIVLAAQVSHASPSSAPATPAVKGLEDAGGEKGGAPAAADKNGAVAPPSNANGGKPADQPGGMFGDPKVLLIMMGAFILLYFWMGRGRRKQEAQHRKMLAELKKGDKIITIGGMAGTVVEARDDEVVVKIDETNNVRVHFARWAIKGVGQAAKAEAPEDKK